MTFNAMRQIINKNVAKFAGFCFINDSREEPAITIPSVFDFNPDTKLNQNAWGRSIVNCCYVPHIHAIILVS